MALQNQAKNSKQAKGHNIVIVFDWDDTLFPSKKLREILKRPAVNAPNNDKKYQELSSEAKELKSKITSEEEKELAELSYDTCVLLLCYVKKYSKQNICIVSESREGWIQKALSYVSYIGGYHHMERLLFNGINGDISKYHPTENPQYKQRVETKKCIDFKELNHCTRGKLSNFVQVINEKAKISDDFVNTFVIIGDSEHEFEAAQKLRECVANVKNMFIHRIKLESEPTIETLMREHGSLHILCLEEYYQNYSSSKREGFCLFYSKKLEDGLGGFCTKD